MRKALLIIATITITNLVTGQNCNCLENFNFLEKRIQNDYAGFNDKISKANFEEYRKYTELYRGKAANITTLKRCEILLDKWLEYFNDKHLQLEITKNIFWTYKKIDSTAILLRLPSFSWNSKPIIDSLIKTNFNEITSTPILIIDLRGNGGGIDYSFLELLPIIYTNPYETKGVSWLASEGNIKFFEEAIKKGEIRKGKENETKEFLKILQQNKNTFVTINSTDTIRRDTVFRYPIKVGVIVNDFCASSCEQFVLSAKKSRKVTVFGTNTLGVLDYSNTVPVDMPTKNFQIRYPMTRSNRLPAYPIDNIGIEPDVPIKLQDNLNLKSEIDEWVEFVKEYLTKELYKSK